jgi:hypothetical protein
VSNVLTLLTLVLGILEKFVSWGAQAKVFKQNEATIALEILKRTKKDVDIARQTELDALNSNPDELLKPDEFTRRD